MLTVQTLQNSGMDVATILYSIYFTAIIFGSIWLVAWILKGKEIITLYSDTLEIRAKSLHIGQLKRYSFSGIRDLRVGADGTLEFDYGKKNIKFAYLLDEGEARYILDLLERRIAA